MEAKTNSIIGKKQPSLCHYFSGFLARLYFVYVKCGINFSQSNLCYISLFRKWFKHKGGGIFLMLSKICVFSKETKTRIEKSTFHTSLKTHTTSPPKDILSSSPKMLFIEYFPYTNNVLQCSHHQIFYLFIVCS